MLHKEAGYTVAPDPRTKSPKTLVGGVHIGGVRFVNFGSTLVYRVADGTNASFSSAVLSTLATSGGPPVREAEHFHTCRQRRPFIYPDQDLDQWHDVVALRRPHGRMLEHDAAAEVDSFAAMQNPITLAPRPINIGSTNVGMK